MLSDAQLLLGLSRHLDRFAAIPAKAALQQLSDAGSVFDLAFRLRGSGANSPARVRAIGLDANLGGRDLVAVVAILEGLRWVSVQRDPSSNAPISVAETIPGDQVMVSSASAVLGMVSVTDVEIAALEVLRVTTMQPLLVGEAIETAMTCETPTGTAVSEAAAEEAIRHLTATALVQRSRTEADEREVLFNPNVWTNSQSVTAAALKAADAGATREVGALIEEVSASPGMPETHVKSTESKWINFAVSQGLVQRTVVQTSEGVEKGFLFTPHLSRGPFGAALPDVSGQVRQLVGSMIYAATFPDFKLDAPATFLRRLIERGVAGDASPIGTDYPMLETGGIVRILPGSTSRKFRMEILQPDIAESAVQVLEGRDKTNGNSADVAALHAQRSYVHVEAERARLAISGVRDDIEAQRLLAAVRETTARGQGA